MLSKQTSLIKLKDALSALSEAGERTCVVFGPDIIRDVGVSEPVGKDLLRELSRVEKDRLEGFQTFVRGGGHALLAANAAIALRKDTGAVRVHLMAKVLEDDADDLIAKFVDRYPRRRGIAPADTEFVVIDKTAPGVMAANVLFALGPSTPIVLGRQPKLDILDYSAFQQARLRELLESADVVAILSLKSKLVDQLLQNVDEGTLRLGSLFCDCSSGDAMKTNYEMIDRMRKRSPSGQSRITLLSMNEHEARLFEMLLRREEAERAELIAASDKKASLIAKRRELEQAKQIDEEGIASVEQGIKQIESFVSRGQLSNPVEAAVIVSRKTGVPLLFHTSQGVCIISSDGPTQFIPSVKISLREGANLVGAGDTLCGAMALALAVKKKSDALLPEEKRLTYEDCLLVANIATAYRLEQVNKDNDPVWFEAVGRIRELYEWASSHGFRTRVAHELPEGVSFIDVERNSSERFGHLACVEPARLLEKIVESCEKRDYWTARVAFEELYLTPGHEADIALSRIVSSNGFAGEIFGAMAIRILAGRKNGFAVLECAAREADAVTAERMVQELAKTNGEKAEPAARIVFGLMASPQHKGLTASFGRIVKNAGEGFKEEIARIARSAAIPNNDSSHVFEDRLMDRIELTAAQWKQLEVGVVQAMRNIAKNLGAAAGKRNGKGDIVRDAIKSCGIGRDEASAILKLIPANGGAEAVNGVAYRELMLALLMSFVARKWSTTTPGTVKNENDHNSARCAAAILLRQFVGNEQVEKQACMLLAKSTVGLALSEERTRIDFDADRDMERVSSGGKYRADIQVFKEGFAGWPAKIQQRTRGVESTLPERVNGSARQAAIAARAK